MKLRTLAKIEFVIRVGLVILALPFWIVEMILSLIRAPFSMVTDKLVELAQNIGNRLLRCSDEVKNGTIMNQYYIRNSTASFALEELKRMANLK